MVRGVILNELNPVFINIGTLLFSCGEQDFEPFVEEVKTFECFSDGTFRFAGIMSDPLNLKIAYFEVYALEGFFKILKVKLINTCRYFNLCLG